MVTKHSQNYPKKTKVSILVVSNTEHVWNLADLCSGYGERTSLWDNDENRKGKTSFDVEGQRKKGKQGFGKIKKESHKTHQHLSTNKNVTNTNSFPVSWEKVSRNRNLQKCPKRLPVQKIRRKISLPHRANARRKQKIRIKTFNELKISPPKLITRQRTFDSVNYTPLTNTWRWWKT